MKSWARDDPVVDKTFRTVASRRLVLDQEPAVEDCDVALEAVVLVHVEGIGRFNLMGTPADIEALAMGFVFGEGLVQSPDEVAEIRTESVGPSTMSVNIRLVRLPDRAEPNAQRISPVSHRERCPVEEALSGPRVGAALRLSCAKLLALNRRMRERQTTFQRTGGTHAALIIDPRGCEIAFAEDVGRSNALDKAVGRCLLSGQNLAGLGVLMSGRVSFELINKAARAGMELVCGVSAPFSLAIEVAEVRNLTLCGFAREGRVTLFSHPFRITDLGYEIV